MSASAYKPLYATLVTALAREGIYVGRTAGYPRVEVHTINEGERLVKDGSLRMVSATVESMTTDSLISAEQMNAANLSTIGALTQTSDNQWKIVGVVETQLQDLTETADTQTIIYRLLQNIEVYLEPLPVAATN